MGRVARVQLAVILGFVAVLELLTRTGAINRLTLIPPSAMAAHLWKMLVGGELDAPMTQTFANVAIAFALSVALGFAGGVAIHGVPRVLRKVARAHDLGWAEETFLIVLPAAAPHLFTGLKLSLAYSFIGVVAGEFILSGSGLGHAIAYAYDSFDNPTMYALMLFVVALAIALNATLHVWEQRLLARRRRQ